MAWRRDPAAPRRQRPTFGNAPASRSRYGLTPAEFEAARLASGDTCYVCREPFRETPFVDHDHRKARAHGHPEGRGCRRCVRGLLCRRCNTVLGFVRDDIGLLRKMAMYLKMGSPL